ncbi:DUF58 domain-containing protein [Sulfurospirillum diekertiae]|uniref:DUF58 domain-containing protein n=1 Tax=Sulfurospirillum diekertiae TaxID=1854492 RepID=A0A1Y0HIM2_9BACT|nr:DUF58 domain-containing protein [Sulfurospirillum diekertiae]ARU47446.1 hypothetical protein Sdiek1_0263 [Sulfurospirillum diekertiae]ASC92295.1 hypothetical protein Sdiek2_0257 [Sulfurospirillum diekertiae]
MQTLSYNTIIARSKKHLFGEMVGSNSSSKEGDGYDFSQIRPYMYGDNVKRIDWKQSVKTGQIQLRSFFEEKEITVYVLGLMSGSIHFGIDRMKQELMAEVVALLGFSAIKNSDFFSLALLSDKLLYESLLSKKEAILREATHKTLQSPIIAQHLNWNFIQDYALHRIKKPSLLFILSDFFEMPLLDAIAKKHSVVVIKIRDHFEEKPTALGSLYIKDPTSLREEKVMLDTGLVKAYTIRQKRFDQQLDSYLKQQGIAQMSLYTNEDPYIKLSSILKEM